ncbi:hypothetical protein FSARC_10281 [Fusarium sarcochroum]|uniref:Uncharacterized protein n=1 Tax=Fusarium sarcochroum TaxID=1208366 RepID=A0A8H4TNI8_9HYPO|nr:hypothetical protein FSARC_10281 [Fusarium sarcochroum]
MAQRTFTLIPQFPGRAQSPDKPPLRPMTSKQVRNAYKAANKGPKLSRAEAWKQEKAEQERIRKEFEKEKAAAKAKIARDKKKEKESAEKEAKRKKGLPLVNVRPSQETISWFVRGNGTAKKRDAQGKDVKKIDTIEEGDDKETTEEPTSEDEPQQAATKFQKLDNIQEADEDVCDVGMEARVQNQPPNPPLEPANIESFEEEAEEDMAGLLDEVSANIESQIPSQKPPGPENELEGSDDELDADFEEDLALGILEDIEAAIDKSKPSSNHEVEAAYDPPPKTNFAIPKQPLDNAKPSLSNRYAEDLGLHRPTPPSVTFVRPPLPEKPQRNPEQPSPSPPRQEPPMSTQAILFNLDDFFPSSSQQARELEEEPDDSDFMPSAPLHLAPIVEEEEEEFSDEEPEKPAEHIPLPILDPVSDSPPPPLKRFFTSSGSHERMCLALQRSRRTAALEKIQQRERSRVQAGMVQRAQAESRNAPKPREPIRKPPVFSKPPPQDTQRFQPRQPPFKTSPPLKEKPNTNTPTPARRLEPPKQPQQAEPKRLLDSKENQQPPEEPFALSASQESYGGEWVDDLAFELMI